MKITKLYQLINDNIIEIPLVDIDELNDRLLNIENNYLTKEEGDTGYLRLDCTNKVSGNLSNVMQADLMSDASLETLPIASNEYRFIDNKSVFYGALVASTDSEARRYLRLLLKVPNPSKTGFVNAWLGLRYNSEYKQTVCECPPPIENTYASIADTLQASINRHPVNIEVLTPSRTLYVGGANASDTTNLWQGRGTSPEMPFATLQGASNYLCKLCGGSSSVNILLQNDITLSSNLTILSHNFPAINIQGIDKNSDIKVKPSGSSPLYIASDGNYIQIGNLTFENIRLQAGGGTNGQICLMETLNFICDSDSITILSSSYLGNMMLFHSNFIGNFSGKCRCVVQAANNAYVSIYSDAQISGDITGKRYEVLYGGVINTYGSGANRFPGTVAGTVDSISHYI